MQNVLVYVFKYHDYQPMALRSATATSALSQCLQLQHLFVRLSHQDVLIGTCPVCPVTF